jgi:hypothetical protein
MDRINSPSEMVVLHAMYAMYIVIPARIVATRLKPRFRRRQALQEFVSFSLVINKSFHGAMGRGQLTHGLKVARIGKMLVDGEYG